MDPITLLVVLVCIFAACVITQMYIAPAFPDPLRPWIVALVGIIGLAILLGFYTGKI